VCRKYHNPFFVGKFSKFCQILLSNSVRVTTWVPRKATISSLSHIYCQLRRISSTGVGGNFSREGPPGDISKTFLQGPEVVKFVFFPLETKKTTFAEIFKIQGGPWAPGPTFRRPRLAPVSSAEVTWKLATISQITELHHILSSELKQVHRFILR